MPSRASSLKFGAKIGLEEVGRSILVIKTDKVMPFSFCKWLKWVEFDNILSAVITALFDVDLPQLVSKLWALTSMALRYSFRPP